MFKEKRPNSLAAKSRVQRNDAFGGKWSALYGVFSLIQRSHFTTYR